MNNYWTHLAFELESIHKQTVEASKIADGDESGWQKLRDVRKSFENCLERIRSAEASAKEKFRKSHESRSGLRSLQGEVEDEFFRNGEEANDWFRHQ